MKVLIDTCVWSMALRKGSGPETDTLRQIVNARQATLIGAVRQEILSGIREEERFEKLRERLLPFEDTPTQTIDYEMAALYFNRCRAKGIQGTNTDFLLCAVSSRIGYPIYTVDQDFGRYARVIDVSLYRG